MLDLSFWNAFRADLENGGEMRPLLAAHLHTSERGAARCERSFRRFIANGRERFSVTWNWWAFVFSYYYFFYRNLYTPGILLFFCVEGLYLYNILHIGDAYSHPFTFFGLSLLLRVLAALGANFLYFRKFQKDLQTAGYPHKPPAETIPTLSRLGGANMVVFVSVLLLSFFGEFFVIMQFAFPRALSR